MAGPYSFDVTSFVENSVITPNQSRLWPACACAIILGAGPLFAADWPTFRGSDRSGVSSETDLLQSWPEAGPQLRWQAQGAGRGYASAAIADGRVYTLGDGSSLADDDDEYLTCFSDADGKMIWSTKTGSAWDEGQPTWQGSRATPTVDGDRVYVLTPAGGLYCCATSDGDVLWKHDLKADFGGKKADQWGYSESPLVDGDNVVCTPGGEQSTMIALNKLNGNLVWTAIHPGDQGAGHSSIVPTEFAGTKMYIQNTAGGPISVAADTGQLLWAYEMKPPTAFIPSPVVKDDLVFSTAGYGLGGALIRQVSRGNGKFEVEEIYPSNPKLANKQGGVVRIGDYIYGGSDGSNRVLCIEMLTGEVQWEARGAGRNSISVAAAGERLYLHFSDGTMVLAEANPAEYVEISEFKTPNTDDRPTWALPSIANGRLYLREDDSIFCYDISGQ
ncbi:outer membrane biogenesis protein BamB [Allorhodopirellula heiligendammensis]|uniref:Outer membrane biogenesis protein BamB n=1 Tax=Allorhodopirellula heiligendammensis TaxID=2714739 RepID=A0A5C6BWN7_9BACT|nr:outer membrane biogenesis protein BamB [Allorhodopirellula heiligendammensis]